MRRALGAGLAGLLLAACAQPATVPPHPGVAWVDTAGSEVPPEIVSLYADDCPGRESGAFLDVRWPLDPVPGVEPGTRRYVRDPEGVMPPERLLAPYDSAGTLPRQARFTGLIGGPFQLYVAADADTYLYLVDGTRVEALPRAADDSVPC